MSLNQQFKPVTFSLRGILSTSMLPCTKFLLCLRMEVSLKSSEHLWSWHKTFQYESFVQSILLLPNYNFGEYEAKQCCSTKGIS